MGHQIGSVASEEDEDIEMQTDQRDPFKPQQKAIRGLRPQKKLILMRNGIFFSLLKCSKGKTLQGAKQINEIA
ncbi:hypothetical protein KIN20_015685 [Parelaphostrongylus tenuis]|uniref:Uncharacterized protein n=1 Tax=Parelaphostrongylus tenuis TaxID=148309 RepID=A0AAD5MXP4_PARTN|nr:hypothetical protein KIN20_015685 [Parelaphostrongylus tenuis]